MKLKEKILRFWKRINSLPNCPWCGSERNAKNVGLCGYCERCFHLLRFENKDCLNEKENMTLRALFRLADNGLSKKEFAKKREAFFKIYENAKERQKQEDYYLVQDTG